PPARDNREAGHQGLRFRTAVALHVGDDDLTFLGRFLSCRLEHGIRLADAGRVSEEDPQLSSAVAALFGLGVLQQRLGTWTRRLADVRNRSSPALLRDSTQL